MVQWIISPSLTFPLSHNFIFMSFHFWNFQLCLALPEIFVLEEFYNSQNFHIIMHINIELWEKIYGTVRHVLGISMGTLRFLKYFSRVQYLVFIIILEEFHNSLLYLLLYMLFVRRTHWGFGFANSFSGKSRLICPGWCLPWRRATSSATTSLSVARRVCHSHSLPPLVCGDFCLQHARLWWSGLAHGTCVRGVLGEGGGPDGGDLGLKSWVE